VIGGSALRAVTVTGLPTRTFTHNSVGDITLDDRKIGVRVELLRVRGYGLQPCRA